MASGVLTPTITLTMVAPGYGYGIVAMAALGYGVPWLWRATIHAMCWGVTCCVERTPTAGVGGWCHSPMIRCRLSAFFHSFRQWTMLIAKLAARFLAA